MFVSVQISARTAPAAARESICLEKSRQATDLANLRDAYAVAKMAELTQTILNYYVALKMY